MSKSVLHPISTLDQYQPFGLRTDIGVLCSYLLDIFQKQFCVNKYQRVSRSVRTDSVCPLFVHKEVFEIISYLKHCHWISLLIYLKQSDFEGYLYCNTGNGLIVRSSLISDCFNWLIEISSRKISLQNGNHSFIYINS